jgi:hypothetical protein
VKGTRWGWGGRRRTGCSPCSGRLGPLFKEGLKNRHLVITIKCAKNRALQPIWTNSMPQHIHAFCALSTSIRRNTFSGHFRHEILTHMKKNGLGCHNNTFSAATTRTHLHRRGNKGFGDEKKIGTWNTNHPTKPTNHPTKPLLEMTHSNITMVSSTNQQLTSTS